MSGRFRLAQTGATRFDETLSNPFATRFVRPRSVAYLFGAGHDARSLVQELKKCGWRGAIVGPHGSGKTTLVHTLLPEIIAEDRNPVLVSLHDKLRRLPWSVRLRYLDKKALLIIDGYEQLNRASRALIWVCQRLRRFGLLVTAHSDVRLPILCRTRGDLSVLHRLIADELPSHGGRVARGEIDRAFERREGNLREALFDLYDVFERRRMRHSGDQN
jgi:hypothetical protein